jgi:hypothetical protein
LMPLDPTRSSAAPSANRLPVPFLNTRVPKKKLGEKMKKYEDRYFCKRVVLSFFLPLPVPGPLRPSTVFVQIILPSKCTRVSLKVSRRNWQETGLLVRKRYINCSTLTVIGDTLIDCWRMYNNRLFNSICKRWNFRWFLKHLQ